MPTSSRIVFPWGENVSAPKQEVEPEQASKPATEEETEASEQEGDSAESAPEAATEPPAPEPEAPTAPLEPAIVIHPQPALQGGQPSCTNLSLHALLEYRRQREKLSFEVGFTSQAWSLFREAGLLNLSWHLLPPAVGKGHL